MSKKKICQLLLTTTLSARQIATQTEVSHNTVTRYREQLQQLGLDWLQVKAMTPADLDSLLNPGRVRARAAFIEPDWSHIHREMARIGVTGALLQ